MTTAELERLEREAEEARARLVGDLARLRSNDQLSEIKERVGADVSQGKNELVGRAKEAARDRADGVLAEIKARVAANPGAALAIGAGLAWHLYRHPPVAPLLVGAGVVSLLRTDPQHPAAGAQAASRAAGFAGSARHRVEDWRADPAGQMGDLADTTRERIAGAAEVTRERLGEAAGAAQERIGTLAEAAREHLGEARDTAARRLRRAGRAADRWTESGRQAAAGAMPESGRDRMLVGAAAVALAAAIGIAAQRRQAAEIRPSGRTGRDRPVGAGARPAIRRSGPSRERDRGGRQWTGTSRPSEDGG